MIGFSIAAPVGPIGVPCIRRTLAAGRVTGLAVGLGAALAAAVWWLMLSGVVSALRTRLDPGALR